VTRQRPAERAGVERVIARAAAILVRCGAASALDPETLGLKEDAW